MTKTTRRKQVLVTTAATLAGIFLIGISAGFFLAPSSSQLPTYKEKSVGFVAGPDAFLQSGGKSAVVLEIAPKYANLTRGESTTVFVNISHRAGTDGFQTLHVIPSGVQGNLGLPSSAINITSEERTELIKQGKPIPGMIELSPFVHYSSSEVTLNAGETKTIQMTVTIPKNLPDEMIGKSIHFAPNLIIAELQGASPDRASDALVFSDVFTATVVN